MVEDVGEGVVLERVLVIGIDANAGRKMLVYLDLLRQRQQLNVGGHRLTP